MAVCSGCSGKNSPHRITTIQSAYHLGRMVSYLSLGLVAGLLGQTVDLAGATVGAANLAATLMGLTLVFMGMHTFWSNKLPGNFAISSNVSQIPLFKGLWRFVAHPMVQTRPILLSGTIGILTGLLPCGWLYSFVLVAAASAHPLQGLFVMSAFWLGTIPVLLSLSLGVGHLSLKLRSFLPRLVAICLILAGYYSFSERFSHRLLTSHHSPQSSLTSCH